jgi:hypothetical protein
MQQGEIWVGAKPRLLQELPVSGGQTLHSNDLTTSHEGEIRFAATIGSNIQHKPGPSSRKAQRACHQRAGLLDPEGQREDKEKGREHEVDNFVENAYTFVSNN